MIDSRELREQCAQQLAAAAPRVRQLTAFVGLDGFVDDILRVVDKRESAEKFTAMSTIPQLAQRIGAAAGKSTNLEVVSHMTKLGGNGPIMANALASFGIRVTYLGILGYPNLHPVFQDFAKRAEVHSIAEPGYTDALEFDDGKVMVGKHASLKEVTWSTILARYGKDPFAARLGHADLIGFVNWTMLPYMSDVWDAVLKDVCPSLTGRRRRMFFDLADPEKRTKADIQRALDLIVRFQKHFDVTLGLNEKEANEIAAVLGLPDNAHHVDAITELAGGIAAKLPIDSLVVHPTRYAVAVTNGTTSAIKGLFTQKPKITTGAGDHFNAGFCLGKLLGLDNAQSLLVGVTNSGHYVRTAESPGVEQLAQTLRQWPNEW
jgi:sugar/nucleoside kinase (ribokinase family)